MGLISWIIIFLGISLFAILIAIIIFQVILLILAIWLVKKHPFLSMFLFLIFLVMAILQTINPTTVLFGVGAIITGIIAMFTQFNRFKKALITQF
jgi:hypothetical protein